MKAFFCMPVAVLYACGASAIQAITRARISGRAGWRLVYPARSLKRWEWPAPVVWRLAAWARRQVDTVVARAAFSWLAVGLGGTEYKCTVGRRSRSFSFRGLRVPAEMRSHDAGGRLRKSLCWCCCGCAGVARALPGRRGQWVRLGGAGAPGGWPVSGRWVVGHLPGRPGASRGAVHLPGEAGVLRWWCGMLA